MTKNDLIKKLDKALILEEMAVPIYNKHLKNTLFLSGYPEDVQELIKKNLKILSDDSVRHKFMIEKLKKIISGGSKNVY